MMQSMKRRFSNEKQKKDGKPGKPGHERSGSNEDLPKPSDAKPDQKLAGPAAMPASGSSGSLSNPSSYIINKDLPRHRRYLLFLRHLSVGDAYCLDFHCATSITAEGDEHSGVHFCSICVSLPQADVFSSAMAFQRFCTALPLASIHSKTSTTQMRAKEPALHHFARCSLRFIPSFFCRSPVSQGSEDIDCGHTATAQPSRHAPR